MADRADTSYAPDQAPNPNALWAGLLVEELVRHGIDTFAISPGSRSAPLTVAVAQSPRAHGRLLLDERAAGFHALGHARATGRPAAVITTSGTAVANLLPAVVEASADHVPLIVLTADRPPELRDTGANQTIRQPFLFADTVRWRFDMPCPDDRIPARVVLSTAAHAAARTLGPDPGPVHLNLPFREPLAPQSVDWSRACLEGLDRWRATDAPWTRASSAIPSPGPSELDALAEAMSGVRSGLIIAASRAIASSPHPGANAIPDLAARVGWPILTDLRSGLRLGATSPHVVSHGGAVLDARSEWRPELVLMFGGRLISKRVTTWLDAVTPDQLVLVDPSSARLDPDHRVTCRIAGDADEVAGGLLTRLPGSPATDVAPLVEDDHRARDSLARALEEGDALSEPYVARFLSREIDPGHALFVGSSLPVREMDSFAAPDGPAVPVGANRGASGIDGTIASAAGFARGLARPLTLLVGDLTFVHDLTSLALIADSTPPVTVVVLDNRGGGIFAFLPIASHPELFDPWFTTPPDVDFESASRAFGLSHVRVSSRDAFAAAYREAVGSGRSSVVVVELNMDENVNVHRALDRAMIEAVRDRA